MATQAQKREESGAAYKYKAPPIQLGDERFKFTSYSLNRKRFTYLDDYVTSATWNDESSELTGTIQLTDASGQVHLIDGQTLRCSWSPHTGAPFAALWALKVTEPEVTAQSHSLTATLTSTLTRANEGTDNYSYRKDKKHPHGWTCDQIARNVSARTHIPIGKLAKGKHRITKLVLSKAKPMDVIVRAYRAERVAENRLFFVYWDGRLNVVPLTPSRELLQFAGAILDAALKESLRKDFATAITVRASTKAKKGRKSKKIHVLVKSDAGIKRYGYVHRDETAPDAHTVAEAKRWGRNLLAKVINPQRTLTVTVPIVPWLKRGAAFRINWKSQGLTQVVYVAGLAHSYSPGSASTAITVQFTSPFRDAREQADKEARQAKARAHGRSVASSTATTGGTSAQAQRRR